LFLVWLLWMASLYSEWRFVFLSVVTLDAKEFLKCFQSNGLAARESLSHIHSKVKVVSHAHDISL
jgi:hypothetical protein